MSIRGDIDGSFPSPKYHGDEKNEHGESNLTPNFSISPASINIADLTSESLSSEDESALYRFVVHVSPFKDVSYPANVNEHAVIFLDSTQLFTLENYKFGEETEISDPEKNEPYYYKPGEGGVYEAPTPLRGAPIEFRRVYFRGKKVDPNKGYTTENEEKTFAAYFPCSLPIEQTSIQSSDKGEEPKGTLYNSRDLNFSYSEHANVLSWEDIDIGGGGSSCGFPFSGFEANNTYVSGSGSGSDSDSDSVTDSASLSDSGSGSGSGSECRSFVFSGTSGIDTFITGDILTISYTGDACGIPFSGFEANSGDTYDFSGSGSGIESGCSGFIFSGTSGIDTSITGNVLTISYTGDACGIPFSGFEANSGDTYDFSGSGSGSGCSGFIFSGTSGIDTSITGNVLTISYTGDACGIPFSGFEANSGDTYDFSDSGSGSGCSGFIFSGTSGIDTSITGNVLTISYTGDASGCHPHSGFEANSGNASGLSGSGCTTFVFSGASGIDTSITGNVLTISYTGDESGCHPHSGFEANQGNASDLSGSGCTTFVFSGTSGIDTSITGNVLTISYTGKDESGCHPHSGFEANQGNASDLSGSGCTTFVFSGTSGIDTSITDNVLTVSYTGCESFFTGFDSDNGSTSGDGCKTLQINGVSGIGTEITDDTLKIGYTGCVFPYSGISISGAPVTPSSTCSSLNFKGSGTIQTIIEGDTVTISDDASTFDIKFEGQNCASFNGYNTQDIRVGFDTQSFFLEDVGEGPEVKFKGFHVNALDVLGSAIPNTKHIAKEIQFQNFDLKWSFGDGGCDSKNIVTVSNLTQVEVSGGCLTKTVDPITEISYISITPDDMVSCLRTAGLREQYLQFICWSEFGFQPNPPLGDFDSNQGCQNMQAGDPATGLASGYFFTKGVGSECCYDPRYGACCDGNTILGITFTQTACDNMGGDVWYEYRRECPVNGACCAGDVFVGITEEEACLGEDGQGGQGSDWYEGLNECPQPPSVTTTTPDAPTTESPPTTEPPSTTEPPPTTEPPSTQPPPSTQGPSTTIL